MIKRGGRGCQRNDRGRDCELGIRSIKNANMQPIELIPSAKPSKSTTRNVVDPPGGGIIRDIERKIRHIMTECITRGTSEGQMGYQTARFLLQTV